MDERKWNSRLYVGEKEINVKKSVICLGLTVDQGMTFRDHVVKVCERMKKRVNVLRALAGREWGWNRSEMIAVYKMLLESCVWNASSAWFTWVSKSYV